MSQKTVIRCLKRFKTAAPTSRTRVDYYRSFLPTMMYRTTRTENPEVTRKTVARVLKRLAS